MHVDSTSIPVRDRDHPNGIQTGSLWGYVGDTSSAVYLYTSTGKKVGQREGELGPEQFLALRRGPVVADAAALFDSSFTSDERVEVGCNMHARRYFVKALDAGDTVPIAAFRPLQTSKMQCADPSPQASEIERERRSKPVYDELLRWAKTYQPGRRNFLFAGSHAGAERAAIGYSVLATCAFLELNPAEYLADVLPTLARGSFKRSDIANLAPAEWKKFRASPRSDS